MVRSGKSPPRASTSSKRLLSNSSLSPLHEGKKTKTFSSPNRFAALSEDNGSLPEVFSPPPVTGFPPVIKKDTNDTTNQVTDDVFSYKAPPIFIKNITNYSPFVTTLSNLTGNNGFSCKSTSSFLIIRPNGCENYNKIIEHIKTLDLECHTYCPPEYRPFKAVIRNLHHSTLTADIINALNDLGHSVQRITNIKKNNFPLPLFFVELERSNNNADIFKISSLLHTMVSIEKPHKKNRGPPQCHKCQSFGHTKSYCSHIPRCVKCGENHLSKECTKDHNLPAKCANCAGDHTASYKGCPKYINLLKKSLPPTVPRPALSTHLRSFDANNQRRSYAETTRHPPSTEQPPDIIINIFNELKSIITPLIALLSKVLEKINLNPTLFTP